MNEKKERRFKKEKKNKKISIISLIKIILIITMIFSGYKIVKWYIENKKTDQLMDQISKSIVVDENNNTIIDFNTLKEMNTDTVAFIQVNGTDIKYPVVKGNDNSYYLTHSFDGSVSSAGWIFADYNNKFDGTDKNIIIYGHNRKDGSMFSSLKNILNKEWYENEENKYVILITNEGTTVYKVFSVYQIEAEDYYITTSFSSKQYSKFLNTMKKRSIYDFGVDVENADTILTLSTCSNNNNYRVVLHAIKTDLKTENNQVDGKFVL